MNYSAAKLKQNIRQYSTYLLIISAVIAFAACTFNVKLVSKYDALVDASVKELQSKTTSFIAKLSKNPDSPENSYNNNKEFYSEVYGEIAALTNRAEVLEDGLQRTPLTDNFKKLKSQYEDLEVLHQTPISEQVLQSVQDAFDQSFRAIVKYLIYLKWN